MNKRLLSLDDLYSFYSSKKKSMTFNSDKSGYNLSVQVKGKFELINENEENLLFARVKAFHDLSNLNHSYIDSEIMKEKMQSIVNRPLMADIIEVTLEDGNVVKDFNGHTMEYDEENDKMNYIEIPVGHFINPDSISLEYDEENDRNFCYCDAVIYEEYTDACDIIRRRGSVDVSVELSIRDLAYDSKSGVLKLNDFYVMGCTLLGAHVAPGMKGSKLTLKDFSESNNSIFSELSEEENSKLIETLEKLNTTLSNFNIQNQSRKEDVKVESNEIKVNEEVNEVIETESTEEVTTENSEETVDTPDVVEVEKCKTKKNNEEEVVEVEKCKTKKDNEISEEFEEDSEESTDSDEVEEVESEENEEVEDTEVIASEEFEEDSESEEESTEDVESTDETNEEESIEESNEVIFSKTFELSHSDVKASLYALLSAYESACNDWFWITEVYDSYFVYQGMMGDYHGQKYVKNTDDTVAFDGEPYNLYAEFLTESERATLTEMRSNYSSIQTELNSYKDAEVMADKMTVFEDEAYSAYLETEEFKALMSEDSVKQFSKEELAEKADAALGKVVKATKTFAMETKKEEEKKPSFFAFARQETQSSFLDGLLKK